MQLPSLALTKFNRWGAGLIGLPSAVTVHRVMRRAEAPPTCPAVEDLINTGFSCAGKTVLGTFSALLVDGDSDRQKRGAAGA